MHVCCHVVCKCNNQYPCLRSINLTAITFGLRSHSALPESNHLSRVLKRFWKLFILSVFQDMITRDAVFSNTRRIVFGQQAGRASGIASSTVLGLARSSHLRQHVQIVLNSHCFSCLNRTLILTLVLLKLNPQPRVRLAKCNLSLIKIHIKKLTNHSLLTHVKKKKPSVAIIQFWQHGHLVVATVGPRYNFFPKLWVGSLWTTDSELHGLCG